MQLDWVPVKSSNLQSIAYEGASKTLHVRFHSSGYYVYTGVPRPVYEGLLNAPSKGSYFDANVKKAGYPNRRMG